MFVVRTSIHNAFDWNQQRNQHFDKSLIMCAVNFKQLWSDTMPLASVVAKSSSMHLCGKLQTAMIRHDAVGISSCKIINNIHAFPYQEINSHKMSHSTIKTTKWHIGQRRQIRGFAVRMKKHWDFSYPLSAQRRPWSDWADADLSLRWFCYVAAMRLKWLLCFVFWKFADGALKK